MRALESPAVAHRQFAARRRWRWEEIAFGLAAGASYFVFPEHLLLLLQILIAGLFALSLDLLQGYTGIPSLGHAAFFGLGAYTAGLLAKYGAGDPLLGLAAAALVSGAFGLVCSFLVARVSGIALLTVTLGVALLLYEVAHRWTGLTGGDDGLQGMKVGPILGLFRFDLFGRTAFLYALAVCLVAYLAMRHLVHSPFGLSLEGIRENPRRARAVGIPVARRLREAFAVSAAVAGISGALLAQTSQFVALEVLSLERSVSALIIVVLGGPGTLIGSMYGAAVYMAARDALSSINPVYWNFWLGLILFAVVMFRAGGIVGGLRWIARRLARARSLA